MRTYEDRRLFLGIPFSDLDLEVCVCVCVLNVIEYIFRQVSDIFMDFGSKWDVYA